MNWREARLGAHVLPGWVPIVDRLHAAVLQLDPDLIVDQVKEKFGGLRYYYTTKVVATEDAIHALVREAETVAYNTCEVCGAPADGPIASPRGWLKTLCPAHQAQADAGVPAWQMVEPPATH